jgi:hypothetical protein
MITISNQDRDRAVRALYDLAAMIQESGATAARLLDKRRTALRLAKKLEAKR